METMYRITIAIAHNAPPVCLPDMYSAHAGMAIAAGQALGAAYAPCTLGIFAPESKGGGLCLHQIYA